MDCPEIYEDINDHIHKVTSSSWLDSSVGKALHRYGRGYGFESCSSLILFSGINFTAVYITALLKHAFILLY